MLLTKPSAKATPTHLKKHNVGLILNAIYAHETISRVQLARLTHLSRPAVTELTHDLLEDGLIKEVGPQIAPSKAGKRPTLLAFNADTYHLLTVDIGDTRAIGALLDLRGRILHRQILMIDNTETKKPLEALYQIIALLIERAAQPLLGIAVGSPGIVDSQHGIVHFAANLNWQNIPLVQLLSERFHLPVHIANDTKLAALGERHFGLGQGVDDLIVVMIGRGIGSGIMVGGRIVEGSAHGAGEIGHIPVASRDNLCVCGRRGCLETVVSESAIAKQAQEAIQRHPDSLLKKLSENGEISATVIQLAADQEDAQALSLIEEMGTYLGLALTIVIHLLNPRRIVLGGSMIRLGNRFIDQVRRTVQERALPLLAGQTDILPTELDGQMVLLGAGALLLERELGLWHNPS